MVIIYVIDEKSLFYGLIFDEFKELDYEVVVVLDGIVEYIGLNIQFKILYIVDEILWGYDFVDVIDRKFFENGKYFVDFLKFNEIYNIDVLLCFLKEFYKMQF